MKFLIIFILMNLFGFEILPKDRGRKSKPIIIQSVKYLDPENFNWKGPVNIYLEGNKISKIEDSLSTDIEGYLTPSFCDAQVTLGSDSLGGMSTLKEARIALRSFLASGFTHILSVADSPWVEALKKEVDSGKIIGPKIYISGRPILKKTEEYENLPEENYFTGQTFEDIQKEVKKQFSSSNTPVFLFHRYHEKNSFYFQSYELSRLKKYSNKFKGKLTVSTFADKVSIMDSLLSGIIYIQHPIPLELNNQIQPQHLKRIKWMPSVNLYRNLTFLSNKEKLQKEVDYLKSNNNFFERVYFDSAKTFADSIVTDEESPAWGEYLSYIKFLKLHPEVYDKLILGSGSGHKLSFPGISGIQELGILQSVNKKKERLFKIPTVNTCSYIGVENSGKIKEGYEANLILYSENPTNKYSHLYKIEKVYYQGDLVDPYKGMK